jgi:hypothetical protein
MSRTFELGGYLMTIDSTNNVVPKSFKKIAVVLER